MKGWEKIFQANGNQSRAGQAALYHTKYILSKKLSQETKKDIIK